MTLSDIASNIALPHGFFSREGGVSTGLYESLNCGPGSGDIADNVAKNRNIVAAFLSGSTVTPLVSCYQVHGGRVVHIRKKDLSSGDNTRPKADGMVTDDPGIILGVLTADCAPVLFADEDAGVVGAAHAGWKGALAGIAENTIEAMERLGARRGRIAAAIGPAIQPISYEVKAEFRDIFLDKDPSFHRFFFDGIDADHYQFNLQDFVRHQISRHGVTNIWISATDSYTSPRHFSYRRSTHHGQNDYGRQLSAIMLD